MVVGRGQDETCEQARCDHEQCNDGALKAQHFDNDSDADKDARKEPWLALVLVDESLDLVQVRAQAAGRRLLKHGWRRDCWRRWREMGWRVVGGWGRMR